MKGVFKLNKFFLYFIIIILFSSLFISTIYSNPINYTFKTQNLNYHYNHNYIFEWPLENNFYISSHFGKRTHPITQKTSYHSGIDIPAAEQTNIFSISDGTVSFTGFLGANGYSIIINYNSFQIIYSHVSPNFIVTKNDTIFSNQLIGFVGPKFLTTQTPYLDSTGYYLNGLTTAPHLHLCIKKDGQAVNPLDYL